MNPWKSTLANKEHRKSPQRPTQHNRKMPNKELVFITDSSLPIVGEDSQRPIIALSCVVIIRCRCPANYVISPILPEPRDLLFSPAAPVFSAETASSRDRPPKKRLAQQEGGSVPPTSLAVSRQSKILEAYHPLILGERLYFLLCLLLSFCRSSAPCSNFRPRSSTLVRVSRKLRSSIAPTLGRAVVIVRTILLKTSFDSSSEIAPACFSHRRDR